VKKSAALHVLADERLESRIAKRVAALSPQPEVALGRSQDDCRSLALRASGDPSAGDEAAKLHGQRLCKRRSITIRRSCIVAETSTIRLIGPPRRWTGPMTV
jgi:hypothetical protein